MMPKIWQMGGMPDLNVDHLGYGPFLYLFVEAFG
jgi:hypothetical protein